MWQGLFSVTVRDSLLQFHSSGLRGTSDAYVVCLPLKQLQSAASASRCIVLAHNSAMLRACSLVINNAGVASWGELDEVDTSEMMHCFVTNTLGGTDTACSPFYSVALLRNQRARCWCLPRVQADCSSAAGKERPPTRVLPPVTSSPRPAAGDAAAASA